MSSSLFSIRDGNKKTEDLSGGDAEEEEEEPGEKGEEERPALPLVDVTVNAALTDSSIFEAILQSIQVSTWDHRTRLFSLSLSVSSVHTLGSSTTHVA